MICQISLFLNKNVQFLGPLTIHPPQIGENKSSSVNSLQEQSGQ